MLTLRPPTVFWRVRKPVFLAFLALLLRILTFMAEGIWGLGGRSEGFPGGEWERKSLAPGDGGATPLTASGAAYPSRDAAGAPVGSHRGPLAPPLPPRSAFSSPSRSASDRPRSCPLPKAAPQPDPGPRCPAPYFAARARGPTISSGTTAAANSSALIRPSATTASTSVVFSAQAFLATLAAWS